MDDDSILVSRAKKLLWHVCRTKLGRRAINAALAREPQIAYDFLLQRWPRPRSFDDITDWPEEVSGFEDVGFLLSSNYLNLGLAHMRLDNAAYLYLYRAARSVGRGTLVELGRMRGGGTFLLAAAMHPEAELYSYDLHEGPHIFGSKALDDALQKALLRYGLAERTHLMLEDTQRARPPADSCAFVFIDATHTYESVRADYEHWRLLITPGGHLLFHDADSEEGPARLVREIDRDGAGYWHRQRGVWNMAHYVRTDVPAEWGAAPTAGARSY